MTRNENNTKCETARWFTRLKNWIVGLNCEPKLMFFVCLCPKFNKTLLTVIEIKLSRGLLSVSSIWNFKINEDVDSCKNHARTHGLKKNRSVFRCRCVNRNPLFACNWPIASIKSIALKLTDGWNITFRDANSQSIVSSTYDVIERTSSPVSHAMRDCAILGVTESGRWCKTLYPLGSLARWIE